VRREATAAVEVSQLAGQCHIVAQAGRIAAWVGDGRAVTAKGVPRRSDLSAVASALDVEIPGHVVSAAHVKAIHRPWIVAEAAGLITVGAARAVAAPDPGRDPLEVWLRGLEAVLRAESKDRRRRGAAVVCPGLLAVLADGRSRDRRRLEDAVFELLESSSPENLVSIGRWSFAEGPVDIALRVLCEFGAVDDGLRLTPLGRWAQCQMQGRLVAPISADLDAADLLRRLAASSEEEAWVQVQPWLARRSPVDAAAQLLRAAGGASASERMAAVDIVSGLGSDALPAWQEALDIPDMALHAQVVLAGPDQDLQLDDAQERWLTVEYGLAALDRSGTEEAYFTVQEGVGMEAIRPSGHPGAAALHDALSRFVASGGGRLRLYQLKITLSGFRPAVWRRVLVPAGASLGLLHRVIQVVMGWDDDHLHAFTADGMRYSDPSYNLEDDGDEDAVRLAKALPRPGTRMAYVYDFGDNWRHDIVLEAILDHDDSTAYPICVTGRGDAPAEDWNPEFPEEPSPFDRDDINRRLAGLIRRGR
jgi:hypothetical protein